MHADMVLMLILAALGGGAGALVAWLRARKRVHNLEMQLLSQSMDIERLEHLETLISHLAVQNDRLVESQNYLARTVRERFAARLPGVSPPAPEVTPH